MAYCVNCGSQMVDEARFCPNCGQPAGANGPASTATRFRRGRSNTVQGDNLQVARIQLRPGQEIYAEAGKMVYKTSNVHWKRG